MDLIRCAINSLGFGRKEVPTMGFSARVIEYACCACMHACCAVQLIIFSTKATVTGAYSPLYGDSDETNKSSGLNS